MFINCLFVGCGGFAGAILRYLCGFIAIPPMDFPLITLGVNFVGSFAIMFFTGFFAKALPGNDHLILFLRVGLCGGFTTFSTFSAETLGLLETGNTVLALIYAVASCVFCVIAALLGELTANALAPN